MNWRAVWRTVVGFFRRRESVSVVPAMLAKPKRERRSVEHSGAHYYLGDLLENLDSCMDALRLIRRADEDAADLFEKIGCGVTNKHALIEKDIQPQFLVSEPPANGCIHLGLRDTDDEVYPQCVYYIKCKRPVNVRAARFRICCGIR